jgi:hypothetical protein
MVLKWNVFKVLAETATARMVRHEVETEILSTHRLWVSMTLYLFTSEGSSRRTFGVNLAC